MICCFAVVMACRKLSKKHENKSIALAQRLSKTTDNSNGCTGQNDIEPKLTTVSFVRQRMVSNSSVISSLSHLLFSDGPRQKEFAGMLNHPRLCYYSASV